MIRTSDILSFIPHETEISAKEVAVVMGVPEKHMYARIAAIYKQGKLLRSGERRSYRYRRGDVVDSGNTGSDSGSVSNTGVVG